MRGQHPPLLIACDRPEPVAPWDYVGGVEAVSDCANAGVGGACGGEGEDGQGLACEVNPVLVLRDLMEGGERGGGGEEKENGGGEGAGILSEGGGKGGGGGGEEMGGGVSAGVETALGMREEGVTGDERLGSDRRRGEGGRRGGTRGATH